MHRLWRALLAATLTAAGLTLVAPTVPASAGIDTQTLGGRYSGSNINFRVYSSRATRIAVYVYAAATGAQEKASYVLTKGTGDVWAVTVSTATLQAAGVTGTVYYGYRAWGPNWPYSASWTKGSSTGFVSTWTPPATGSTRTSCCWTRTPAR
ncbi:hypothetical protein ACFQY4_23965 [Catellatospora bangladeshensis]|uniref:hypothetical protein n=1 Tax=Catellatospora bangladeshensis TaxID=310355 RepID=UPI00360FCB83